MSEDEKKAEKPDKILKIVKLSLTNKNNYDNKC